MRHRNETDFLLNLNKRQDTMKNVTLVLTLLACLLQVHANGQEAVAFGNQTLLQCVGTLHDSGLATANYSNNEDLLLVIAPEGAVDLTLDFTSWDVEEGYDFLYIYDGTTTEAPLLGTFSGVSPSTIRSTSGAFTLRFVTDASVTLEGWTANWSSFGRGCGEDTTPEMPTFSMTEQVITECVGKLYDSGMGLANYGNEEDVILTIAPPGANGLTLDFTAWDMEAGYDGVFFYEGNSIDGELLAVHSAIAPTQIVSKTGSITLHFISDISVTRSGFEATWTSYGRGCGLEPNNKLNLGTPVFEALKEKPALPTIQPNPATDFVTIEATLFEEEVVNISLLDMNGRLLEERQIATLDINEQLDVSALPAGVYLVRLASDSLNTTQKIVKQ